MRRSQGKTIDTRLPIENCSGRIFVWTKMSEINRLVEIVDVVDVFFLLRIGSY